MPEAYIPLENAAQFEGITYKGLTSRIQRNPKSFKIKEEPRESGRARMLVAVSSLSTKARRIYRAEHKTKQLQGDDLLIGQLEGKQPPWYVETDHHWYIENYLEQYNKAQKVADLMRLFTDYSGEDRTGYSKRFAKEYGMTQRTLYRMSQNYLEASAWALKYERITGDNHDFFKVLALCRKPKKSNTFPSIHPEIKALIENIWFDEKFRRNLGTIQMLYDKLEGKCSAAGISFPSYQTVARYINHLMEDRNGRSAAYLAERGTRDWKNRFMMKAERDIKSLAVMEIVMGDVHTFDFFVKYVPKNGRPIAIRPKLIAWMEVHSRRYVGYALCRDSNTDDIKNSFAKMVRQYGAPKNLLIDNGKDFANRETLGHDRKERLIFDVDIAGFYKAIGVQEVFRSLPFQPWDKGQLERSFETVCNLFSKWIDSYTGTLTGSRTAGKVKKDIPGMLKRDELFTMEEVYQMWERWVSEVYDHRVHRGLKDAGEEFITPHDLFENAENRYFKAAPPDSYIAMLLMQSKRVPVKPIGIRHNKALYASEDLQPYFNDYVNIRFKPDDDSSIFAFTREGEFIGEIPLAEKLNPHFYADQAQVEEHKSRQNRQLRRQRETLEDFRTPFEQRSENADATPRLVGGIDLTIGKNSSNNVVTLPTDKQFEEQTRKKSRKGRPPKTEFYDKLGQAALEKLNKLG